MTNGKMTFTEFKQELKQTKEDMKFIRKNIIRINKRFNEFFRESNRHITAQFFFETTCQFDFQRNNFIYLHSLIEKYYSEKLSKMNLYDLQSYFDFKITSSS